MDNDAPLDLDDFVRHIEVDTLRFARSARKHGVSREHVRDVAAHPVTAQAVTTPSNRYDTRILLLGRDRTGRMLEVIAIIDRAGAVVVIHAMNLRDKYRPLLGDLDHDA